jgi:hypothetical protein
MSQPKIFADGSGNFIVETETRGELRYGRLVNLKDGKASSERPVDSICHHMPYSDFQEFTGDAEPILNLLKTEKPA